MVYAIIFGNNLCWICASRKKDESKNSDFKDAAEVCLPLIHAALEGVEKGTFLRGCLLNIGVPSSPTTNKVILLTEF